MRNKNWKKLQSKVNKSVKAINKNIYDDDLWLGRFYIKQTKSEYCEFEDKSGGILRVWLKFIDKKTKVNKIELIQTVGNEVLLTTNLFWRMNDFITGYIDVWSEDVSNNRIDYRKKV
jgi:hypothetical protein